MTGSCILVLFIIIPIIHFSNALSLSNVLSVHITNTYDSIGDPMYCNGINSILCNVRSAFMYCNMYSNSNTNTSCQIGTQLYLLFLILI